MRFFVITIQELIYNKSFDKFMCFTRFMEVEFALYKA